MIFPLRPKLFLPLATMAVAEATPIPGDWLSGLREFGSMMILGAGVFYFFRSALPDMIAAHRKETETQRDVFVKALAEQRQDHAGTEAQQRADYLNTIKDFSIQIQKLTEVVMAHDQAMRVAHENETREMFESLTREQQQEANAKRRANH